MNNDRKPKIASYIKQHRKVTLLELQNFFGVSMNTIRRDVAELIEEEKFKKIYGGVCVDSSDIKSQHDSNDPDEIYTIKNKFCETAASYIEDNDIIYIDNGTSTRYILEYIPRNYHVTVITNGLYIMNAAVDKPNIILFAISGIFNRNTLSFNGEISSKQLQDYNINKAFLSCTGLSAYNGATNSSVPEHKMKEIAAQKAITLFLIADSRKFGISTLMTFCPIENIGTLITDKMPPSDICDIFQANSHNIIVV